MLTMIIVLVSSLACLALVALDMLGERKSCAMRPMGNSHHVCPICRELHTMQFCPNNDGGRMEEIVQRTLAQECPLCGNARRNCGCMERKD